MALFRFTILLGILTFVACNSATTTEKKSGNPILEGWYADPEVTIMGNKYWIFPTYSARYEKQVFLDAFSSTDLTNWEKHPAIIDTSTVKWAKMAMWAPCAVEKDGKYYLFFAANDIQSAERLGIDPSQQKEPPLGGIGIGIASSPEGPYSDYLGKPLINDFYNKAQPIDQFVFKDDDGTYYIIYGGWGKCNIARLNDDFTELVPFDDGAKVREITPDGYVEGPVLFKKEDTYYLMWSEGGWTNHSYRVAYGTAKSPMGPFEKTGTILTADTTIATGAGHHSVLSLPGTNEWYIVYHRRPIPNEDRDHRVVCIDRMYFDKDGTIKNIIMTNEGVSARPLK